MPNSPASLERLFHSNVRMSPSQSRKPVGSFTARRAALNRAAHALDAVKEARRMYAKLGQEIPKLEKEYHKLARRAAMIPNANLRTGRLRGNELTRLHRVAQLVKTVGTARRTMRRTPLPRNLQNKIARSTVALQR